MFSPEKLEERARQMRERNALSTQDRKPPGTALLPLIPARPADRLPGSLSQIPALRPGVFFNPFTAHREKNLSVQEVAQLFGRFRENWIREHFRKLPEVSVYPSAHGKKTYLSIPGHVAEREFRKYQNK